ncbi:MbeB family mobilization protein [Enterobacter sp. 166D1]|uniref:MbeB family mobilization protein n=1 Tax=Enterobacter sp. 166D1 TaxID=3077757 RepID=UPI002A8327C5|nr:MbeB family mobilization protein [Enterobacter sp. 166D1]
MNNLLALGKDLEQKSKAQREHTGTMLKAAFSEHEQSVRAELTSSAKRISDAISAHEKGMNEAMRSNRLNVLRLTGRLWLSVVTASLLLIGTSGSVLWWQGETMLDNYRTIREQEQTQDMLARKNNGVQLSTCGTARQTCVKVNPKSGRFGDSSEWMILAEK